MCSGHFGPLWPPKKLDTLQVIFSLLRAYRCGKYISFHEQLIPLILNQSQQTHLIICHQTEHKKHPELVFSLSYLRTDLLAVETFYTSGRDSVRSKCDKISHGCAFSGNKSAPKAPGAQQGTAPQQCRLIQVVAVGRRICREKGRTSEKIPQELMVMAI